MTRPILLCTTLALLGGVSQFATPLAISAQGTATISARATVIDGGASWEAHRTGREVARALASWAGDGEGVVARAGEEGVHSVVLARDLPTERALRVERVLRAPGTAVVVAEVGVADGAADEARPSASAGDPPAAGVEEESVEGESPRTARRIRVTVAHVAY